jgi:NAD(P)-dependent dehydrogenase (short-subunit alcohol dehydrogenase family)
VQVDITSKESIQKLYEEISAKESQMHLLVNNVSVPPLMPFRLDACLANQRNVVLQAGISGPTRSVEKGQESAEALGKELMADSFEDWQSVYA